jgi:hemoglobin-like flavoprotein
MANDNVARVQASYARCIASARFLDRFYDIFMAHPDIKPLFAKTDMAKQKHLLRHGLSSVLMYAESDAMARSCLLRIQETHGRHKLNINPRLYPIWVDSLMRAIAEHDPRFGPELEGEWRDVIAPGIELIVSGY